MLNDERRKIWYSILNQRPDQRKVLLSATFYQIVLPLDRFTDIAIPCYTVYEAFYEILFKHIPGLQ